MLRALIIIKKRENKMWINDTKKNVVEWLNNANTTTTKKIGKQVFQFRYPKTQKTWKTSTTKSSLTDYRIHEKIEY